MSHHGVVDAPRPVQMDSRPSLPVVPLVVAAIAVLSSSHPRHRRRRRRRVVTLRFRSPRHRFTVAAAGLLDLESLTNVDTDPRSHWACHAGLEI